MPEAITAAIAAIGAEVGGSIGAHLIMYAPQLAYATVVVSTFGYSANQRRRMERRARAAYNAAQRDRTLTVRGTLEERELVMGRVHKGGVFYPVGTTGADSETFTFLVLMAGHSISAVNTNYFDEHALTLDGDGWVTSAPFVSSKPVQGTATITMSGGAGSVTLPNSPISGSVSVVVDQGAAAGTTSLTPSVVGSTVSVSGFGSYSGPAQVQYSYADGKKYARIRWSMGSTSQAARADLISDFPSLWTTDHRLRGCAYARIDLLYSPDIFPNGVPNFSANIDGADTVVDPRASTTGFSQNPALLARWYALHPLGGRRTTAQLDEPSFTAAATVCDTSVDYGDGATALYQAGYVAKAGQAPAEVLDELAEAMAGRWGYTQGTVRVRAGAVATPVATITTDWLLTRQMSTRARRARAELRNVLQGTFPSLLYRGQAVQFQRVKDAPGVASDGVELPAEVEFQAVGRNGQAQQVAACMLRYERQALIVTLHLKMRAWPLQLFDVVAITLADMGWSGKLFEVLDRSFSLGGGVSVTFKEIDSSIFAFGTSFPTTDPAPNTELPDPRTVATIGTVTVTSTALARADGTVVATTSISWPAIADAGVLQGGWVEVGIADARTGVLAVARADRIDGHQDSTLTPGVHYRVYARAVNTLGVRGDWSAVTLHQVARKTAAPSNVAGLTAATTPGGVLIQWTASTDADYGGTELRVGASWAGGTFIFRAHARAFLWAWPTAGSYTVRARHLDTSGNYSAADATASVTVDDSALINTPQVVVGAATTVYDFTVTVGPTTRSNIT